MLEIFRIPGAAIEQRTLEHVVSEDGRGKRASAHLRGRRSRRQYA